MLHKAGTGTQAEVQEYEGGVGRSFVRCDDREIEVEVFVWMYERFGWMVECVNRWNRGMGKTVGLGGFCEEGVTVRG